MSTSLSAQGPSAPPSEMLEPPLWPITVERFEDMVRLGIVSEKERVYLWKGRLAIRMAPNAAHALAVSLCHEALRRVVRPGWHIREEKPVRFRSQQSVPEPDLMLVRGPLRGFSIAHPTTADVAIVIEVADSSLRFDRQMALDYAAEGVPVYWVVNLPDRCIELYSEPAEGIYRKREIVAAEASVPVVIDGVEVGRLAVSEVLPA